VEFDYHRFECDVGFVQATPFHEDLSATLDALNGIDLAGEALDRLVDLLAPLNCRLIVSDVAPLGLAAAVQLSIPGVLVENFTWDWIYQAYNHPFLDSYGQAVADLNRSASLRIQTEPVCQPSRQAFRVRPVSRVPRMSSREVRRMLGLAERQPMVLFSLAGFRPEDLGRRAFRLPPEASAVIMGPDGATVVGKEKHREPRRLYHPDLVSASDLVVAKLGYSTAAEVYRASTAFAYLRRPGFPESPVLERFVRENNPCALLAADWLEKSDTGRILETLLEAPRPSGSRPTGEIDAAARILGFV
jgi:hypothetical protein